MDRRALFISLVLAVLALILAFFLLSSEPEEEAIITLSSHHKELPLGDWVFCEITFPSEFNGATLLGDAFLKYKAPNKMKAEIIINASLEGSEGQMIIKSIATGKRIYSYNEVRSENMSYGGDWTTYPYSETWLPEIEEVMTIGDFEELLAKNMDSAILNGIPLDFTCSKVPEEIPDKEFVVPF
jgi:hypothetical protein